MLRGKRRKFHETTCLELMVMMPKESPSSSQIRACMVAYTFYESDGRVMRYGKALAQAGAAVDAVVLRRPGQAAQESMDGVNVLRIQEREKNEKGKLAYLWRIVLFLVRSFFVLSRLHWRKQYDVIHVHSVPDFEVFAALFAKLTGAKVILDIHDIVPEFYAAKFGKKTDSWMFRILVGVERASCAFADHVIIANDLWRNRLVERSVPAEKCMSLINFPDVEVFRPGLRTRRSNGKFLILYPGSLNHHQGLDLAIEAVALLRAEYPDVEFEIWGEGPEKERLQEQIKDLGLEQYVRLHGPRPIREISQVMGNADLGVVPKRDDSFGGDAFSTKILEFMALGVPLVVADTRVDRFYFDDSLLRFFAPVMRRTLRRQYLRFARTPAALTDEWLGVWSLLYVTTGARERGVPGSGFGTTGEPGGLIWVFGRTD